MKTKDFIEKLESIGFNKAYEGFYAGLTQNFFRFGKSYDQNNFYFYIDITQPLNSEKIQDITISICNYSYIPKKQKVKAIMNKKILWFFHINRDVELDIESQETVKIFKDFFSEIVLNIKEEDDVNVLDGFFDFINLISRDKYNCIKAVTDSLTL